MFSNPTIIIQFNSSSFSQSWLVAILQLLLAGWGIGNEVINIDNLESILNPECQVFKIIALLSACTPEIGLLHIVSASPILMTELFGLPWDKIYGLTPLGHIVVYAELLKNY